jgi:hypothetical protein
VFRTLRRTFLVLLLGVVALSAWRARQRIAEWRYPVRVVVYPIVGDDSEASRHYVDGLTKDDFEFVEIYLNDEARRYEIEPEFGKPVNIDLASEIREHPPTPPTDGNVLAIMWWSLQLRYWAWRVDHYDGPEPQVRVFVSYFDPAQYETLEHSVGMEEGGIGVVNAFASESLAGPNNVVIAHELLHTMGATDKYDAETTLPRFPDGYADPEADPLHPQRFAEIMAGRIPLTEAEAKIPDSLNSTLIGEGTAREINWLP